MKIYRVSYNVVFDGIIEVEADSQDAAELNVACKNKMLLADLADAANVTIEWAEEKQGYVEE